MSNNLDKNVRVIRTIRYLNFLLDNIWINVHIMVNIWDEKNWNEDY